ncbi:14-3-3 protein [Trichomonas vaginalis G3]|uniref:14-3-3 protein n=1 Tax=Trichomonas vaginalis (strain ATCC PRA-98 / G3) TaxID=412133 RepID=A2FSF9_TRIV3|nr:protein domain specific binding [Trichomonas vaginalis G3]EAX92156.1 14-3-3 protein [Trichomonas vaginalis G3]KAI5538934.1 protein domain specific binding [Trichomonas vaginalis G3]|eukprot:XP_001305086.1 14-3-3 protein [Trichomonas vaginalis G3]
MLNEENKAAFQLIKILHNSGRPKDTVFFLQKMATAKKELDDVFIPIFVQAHKAYTNEKRNAIRVIDELIAKKEIEDENYIAQLENYRQKKYDELYLICERTVALVDKILIPNAPTQRIRFIYYKMKADFLRYQAEYAKTQLQPYFITQAADSYQNALLIAKDQFEPESIQYLGLVLNYTVFLYEFKNMKVEAIKFIETTLDMVMPTIYANQSKYADSQPYVQMLRDNSTLWRRETDLPEEKPPEPEKKEENPDGKTENKANDNKNDQNKEEKSNTENNQEKPAEQKDEKHPGTPEGSQSKNEEALPPQEQKKEASIEDIIQEKHTAEEKHQEKEVKDSVQIVEPTIEPPKQQE